MRLLASQYLDKKSQINLSGILSISDNTDIGRYSEH